MSTLGDDLDGALAPGVVRAERDGREVEVEVVDVDRLGAAVRSVRVRVPDAGDLREQAQRLPDALRTLPDRIVPVEIAPTLGGAVYRSRLGDVREGRYFEVRTTPREAQVERLQAGPEGREPVPFTVTREQLRRLVDDVSDALSPVPEE